MWSWLKGWLTALLGALVIAGAALLAYRATRERERAGDQSEAELREQATVGTGEARKHALVALDRLKRAEHIEREANRKLDKGARNAKAETVLSRWHTRAERL